MYTKKSQKLYCFVDETGQDTRGQLYIIVAIVTVESKERLFASLESAEAISGKGKLKWHKNATSKRDDYIHNTLRCGLPLKVYYQIFEGQQLSYELTTVLATGNALRSYIHSQNITDYKATIIIDGLPRSMQGQTAKLLRSTGVRTKSVRGERDESNPGIRLADSVAGLVRQSLQGNKHFLVVKNELEKLGAIERLL